ncbi:hypothetical protein CEUSTIGMA_g12435.t1 [Chlamydomonas eustigma]|uniref:Transcription initiation factor TFIID subunit 13 n=1 Tax=Chlamydomonas eustigma TaxID=1157962 RepID=A0A250XPK2_9CHLO|nr:hypothetical protein CEUSTIGMA_g12435.t1 [Chlamydomonas eustigma]|eukprot:GAX85014.1 hypothetical protein CEUSTIGMA_g12435.t1 [Chlamydomonas eustigma]
MDKSKRIFARGGRAAGRGGGGSTSTRGGVTKRGKGRGHAEALEEISEPLSSFKGIFNKDLRIMMYGFGDDVCPLDETVELVEDIMLEYVKEATHRAAFLSAEALKSKVDERDILLSVRKDPAKFARVRELLAMQQIIKDARNTFKETAAEDAIAADEAAGGGDEGE